jgi:hypothetical protein
VRRAGALGATLPDDVGGGKYESHFRVGSEPHLLAIAACASKDATLYPKLLLELSELVDVLDPPPIAATVDGRRLTQHRRAPAPDRQRLPRMA